MATNWDDYTEITTPADGDTFLEHDVSETVVGSKMKKITWANIKATLLTYFYTIFPNKDGWMPVSDTWTYASASTINVPAGALTTYSQYSKVKFNQHGVTKFGYIFPTSNTLLTYYAGSNFVVEDTATYPITNICFSNVASPLGFPQWFSWAPTLVNITVVGTPTYAGTFSIIGRLLKFSISATSTTSIAFTANSTYCDNLPVAAAAYGSFNCVNYGNVTPYGTGLVFSGLTRAYFPTISATQTVMGSGDYRI